MSNESLGDRIRKLRSGVSQVEFAKKYGVSKNTLWSYENGSSEPKASFVMQLATDFGVSADWLLFGAGEMPTLELSSKEQALISNYRTSDDEEKQILERTGARFAVAKAFIKIASDAHVWKDGKKNGRSPSDD